MLCEVDKLVYNPASEIPDPDNFSPKEVYAFFGLACYQAQVLEKGVSIMVVAFKCKGLPITRNDFDAIYSEHNKKTLGQLLARAKKAILISEYMEFLLEEALLKRNWLMHHYFADRSIQFMREEGRRKMISELQSLIQIFIEADQAIEEISFPVLKEFGVTEESVGRIIQDWLKENPNKDD
jgi:hypothetical protein